MGKHEVRKGRREASPKIDASFGDARSRRERIKDAQLCAEVREIVSLVLAQSHDERLQALFVMDVIPAPDSSRLAIRIEVPKGYDPDRIRELLESLAGELRSEVADSIQRKRTPLLSFVVGYGGSPPE